MKLDVEGKVITQVLRVLCIAGTIVTAVYCIYTYILNQDVSVVTFRELRETDEDIYPTISLCFGDAAPQDQIQGIINNNLSKESSIDLYQKYLDGNCLRRCDLKP